MASNHLLRSDAQLTCPHGGKLALQVTTNRVTVGGKAVLNIGSPTTVSGCNAGCTAAQWFPAPRVTVAGMPAALASTGQAALGVTVGPSPGPPTTLSNQTRARTS